MRFTNNTFLQGKVVGPCPIPKLEARVSHFVWVITFHLSGMGDSTSSYATASIAFRIIGPCKPHHYIKVGIPSGRRLKVSFTNIISFIQSEVLHLISQSI
jgi:hypothetical protein